MLAMYDIGRPGQPRWVWDRQLSDRNSVTWYNWSEERSNLFPRSDRRCALMARPTWIHNGWIDFPCDGTVPYDSITNINHICERSDGMFT